MEDFLFLLHLTFTTFFIRKTRSVQQLPLIPIFLAFSIKAVSSGNILHHLITKTPYLQRLCCTNISTSATPTRYIH